MEYRLHPGIDPEMGIKPRMVTTSSSYPNPANLYPSTKDMDNTSSSNKRYPDYCKTMIVKGWYTKFGFKPSPSWFLCADLLWKLSYG